MAAAMNDASLIADIGEAIRDQLHALSSDPTACRAADVATNLDCARQAVLRLREALLSEAST